MGLPNILEPDQIRVGFIYRSMYQNRFRFAENFDSSDNKTWIIKGYENLRYSQSQFSGQKKDNCYLYALLKS
jgi:hypothetical protein